MDSIRPGKPESFLFPGETNSRACSFGLGICEGSIAS
jgi:hypothetical protein